VIVAIYHGFPMVSTIIFGFPSDRGIIMYAIFDKLCKEKGVSAYKVSKATGISTATLSDWKTGKSHPKADKIQKIADYFGVSTQYLTSGVENTQHQDYYTDHVTAQIAEDMATNPNLRMLYDVQRDMDPEDLQAMYSLAMALKRKTERLDSDDPA